MKQLALDAGPLIALFFEKDTYHAECRAGFNQLQQQKTVLVTPVPIIFEVYKRSLQTVGSNVAKMALEAMLNTLYPIFLTDRDLNELNTFVSALSNWEGSLEDASVLLIAQRYHCPIWTLNYRDFGSFRNFEFWNPIAG